MIHACFKCEFWGHCVLIKQPYTLKGLLAPNQTSLFYVIIYLSWWWCFVFTKKISNDHLLVMKMMFSFYKYFLWPFTCHDDDVSFLLRRVLMTIYLSWWWCFVFTKICYGIVLTHTHWHTLLAGPCMTYATSVQLTITSAGWSSLCVLKAMIKQWC